MVRYARRSTYRRKGRRGGRTLSTRRIFNNKGAKAQAAQIYALRKSVNRVRRQCLPEIKNYVSPQLSVMAVGIDVEDVSQTYHRISFPLIPTGTDDAKRIGNKIKLLPCTLFMNGLYRVITHTSSGIPLYNTITSKGCGMRVVAVQSRTTSVSNGLPTPEDIFDTFETSSNAVLTMANLNNPFKRGITSNYHILYDKVFYFNDNKPLQNLKIRLNPRMKHLRWEDDVTYPAGQITVFVMFGGLQSTSNNLNESDYNAVELTHWVKIPYTDA